MMKNTPLIIFLLAILLTIAANLQAAQVNFMPVLTLSEEYTDNLYLDSDDNNKVDDYITTAGLSLTTEVRGQTAGLELNYSPSCIIFADNDELDYWRHSGRFYLWNAFKRNTRLELTSIYLETEDPRDQSDEAVDGPAIGVDPTRRDRDRYSRHTNELRLSHQFGSRNSIFGAVAYNLARDINPPAGAVLEDNNEVRPSFGFEYWFGPQWGLDIDAYYSDRTYDDEGRDDRKEYHGSIRILKSFSRRLSGYLQYQHTQLDYDLETTDEDYQILAPSIGIQYQLRDNTSLRLGAGYYTQEFDESEDDTGSFVDAEMNSRWNYRMGYIAAVVSAGYDIEDTGAEDLGLQIYYSGSIEAGYNFTRRFSGDIYASYRYDDYPNQDPERSDQTLNAGAGISYQALRWMRLRLSYNHENVTSDMETDEFTANSVLFTVTFAPSNYIRLN